MKLKDHVTSLGDLVDPDLYHERLNLEGCSPEQAASMLDSMLAIRLVEEAIADLIESGEAKCPCHLGIGQEAVAVGIAQCLRTSDRVFGAHRSHSHFLSMGGSIQSLLCEVLGKQDGCSRGMGGSMHLFGQEFGFFGSVPIVAGTVPLAVGAALAALKDQRGDIAVAYFGDGASEEGVIHESLNLASIYQLPVLFVCENNLYSSHLDIAQRQPTDSIARFAKAHSIDNIIVEGNDVIEVKNCTAELVEKMRGNPGPAFIEAVTYRWRGHVGPDENVDVGVRRSAKDLLAWKRRDPIKRLYEGMAAEHDVSTDLRSIRTRVENEVRAAVAVARQSPYPADELNQAAVYAGDDS